MTAALALAGCTASAPAPAPAPPRVEAPQITPDTPPSRSLQAEQLARYYARLQADLLAQGLLRKDGGGPDTPFGADQLARNFETIAFYDEYAAGAGLGARGTVAGRLRRWTGPVRIAVEFGPSAPPAQVARDRAAVSDYARRLARVTNHPIALSEARANFHVLFMGTDDRAELDAALTRLVPDMSTATRAILTDLPRTIHCLVVAFADGTEPQGYTRALALIRTEHPDLVRLSCIHEELAQGLGLANDSPAARPSIFNDDDEFALLTSHDERLLTILYDPRLRPGMTVDEARPIIRVLAENLAGAGS